MFILIAQWILNAVALSIVSVVVRGVIVENFFSALIAVVVIGLVNTILKPVLVLLTLPITILTLGLFRFVLNALLFMLVGSITPGLQIVGFGSALLGSLLFTLITMIFNTLVKK